MAETSPEKLCDEARAAVKKGDFQSGRDLYERALGISQDSAVAHFGLGTCCFLLKDLDSAYTHFQLVTELDPLRVSAHINLGAILNRRGEFDEAIKRLRQAVEIDPRRPEAFYNLGTAYRSKGMIELAKEVYQQATLLNPKMVEAFVNLGDILTQMEFYEDARDAYQKALALRPEQQAVRAALEKLRDHCEVEEDPRPAAGFGFANVSERAEAIVELRENVNRCIELCKELEQVIEVDVLGNQRELSKTLVGVPAFGVLEGIALSYGTSLQRLQQMRSSVDNVVDKIKSIGRRFAEEESKNKQRQASKTGLDY